MVESGPELMQGRGSGVSSVPTGDAWELDFCSRPMMDDRGKKVWELLICDESGEFQYSQYFANNQINSKEVRMGGRMIGRDRNVGMKGLWCRDQ